MSDKYTVESLTKREPFLCSCGKTHRASLEAAEVSKGAISLLAGYVKKYGGTKAFVLADKNTFSAAGEKVMNNLAENGIDSVLFIFEQTRTEPDEAAVGSAVLHFDHSCDIIVGVGSGVINDIGKIVAAMTGLPYIIVGTAPSMDGYASSTSSVIRDGLKVSVNSSCPNVVIGDLDVLCAAPVNMIRSGLGDMLAKYISICEWRIGKIVTGEYYCEDVAEIIRAALKKCVDSAAGITAREPEAVKSVMEGMIISGIAADYAGVSRPVSGVEHYFSHLWDMRSIEFGTPQDLHGIQCGVGTLQALKAYEFLVKEIPDKETAFKKAATFDKENWFSQLRDYLGNSSVQMIKNAENGLLYNLAEHEKRIVNIVENWNEILKVIEEELPSAQTVKDILDTIGAPASPEELGLPSAQTAFTFKATKDIRDKYILSTLMWDMGILDTAAEKVFGENEM